MTTSKKTGGPLEIERKFLVAYPDKAMLQSLPGCLTLEIVQTYLEGGSSRVRKSQSAGGCIYTHTRKQKISELTRLESEREISSEEYAEYLKSADPAYRPIEKTRLCIPCEGHVFEIDIYPFWQDKAVAEVELKDEDEDVILPDWLDIIKEVTYDPSYKNAALARKERYPING